MKLRIALAVLALAGSAFGMSQKQKVSVRFHPEVNPNDGTSFAMPVKLHYLRRDAHLSRVPAMNEKQIKAIFPFPADDGTWGCHFQFDPQGRLRLETMSTEQVGTALVLIVGTKTGQHQVIDMLIDRPILSGELTVPRGLTAAEVVVMKTQFPVLGEEKSKKKKKPDAKPADTAPPPPSGPPSNAPAGPAVPKEDLQKLDLPRLRD